QQGDCSKAGLRREHDRAVRDRDPAAGGGRQPGGVDRGGLGQGVIADEGKGGGDMRGLGWWWWGWRAGGGGDLGCKSWRSKPHWRTFRGRRSSSAPRARSSDRMPGGGR